MSGGATCGSKGTPPHTDKSITRRLRCGAATFMLKRRRPGEAAADRHHDDGDGDDSGADNGNGSHRGGDGDGDGGDESLPADAVYNFDDDELMSRLADDTEDVGRYVADDDPEVLRLLSILKAIRSVPNADVGCRGGGGGGGSSSAEHCADGLSLPTVDTGSPFPLQLVPCDTLPTAAHCAHAAEAPTSSNVLAIKSPGLPTSGTALAAALPGDNARATVSPARVIATPASGVTPTVATAATSLPLLHTPRPVSLNDSSHSSQGGGPSKARRVVVPKFTKQQRCYCLALRCVLGSDRRTAAFIKAHLPAYGSFSVKNLRNWRDEARVRKAMGRPIHSEFEAAVRARLMAAAHASAVAAGLAGLTTSDVGDMRFFSMSNAVVRMTAEVGEEAAPVLLAAR